MKYLALISALCMAVAFTACGSDSSAGTTQSSSTESTAEPKKSSDGEQGGSSPATAVPNVRVPPGPPPKYVVVKDLKKGSGATIKSGERIHVYYIGVNYKTGKPFEVAWRSKSGPSIFRFGTGETIKGWTIGLKGMKVGGRRELIVPSKFAYGTGALIYVIELVAISE